MHPLSKTSGGSPERRVNLEGTEREEAGGEVEEKGGGVEGKNRDE